MNLKEAFRFQNKLQSLMDGTQSILGVNSNITKVQNTYLRHKVMAEAEDETTVDAPSAEYSDQITVLAEFLMHLLTEREKLSAAIHKAKTGLALTAGLDGEVSLNGKRQDIAKQSWSSAVSTATGARFPNHKASSRPQPAAHK